jgi:hypothetical protein
LHGKKKKSCLLDAFGMADSSAGINWRPPHSSPTE